MIFKEVIFHRSFVRFVRRPQFSKFINASSPVIVTPNSVFHSWQSIFHVLHNITYSVFPRCVLFVPTLPVTTVNRFRKLIGQMQKLNLDKDARYFVFCFSSHCITELMNESIGSTYAQDLERVVSKILSAWQKGSVVRSSCIVH